MSGRREWYVLNFIDSLDFDLTEHNYVSLAL